MNLAGFDHPKVCKKILCLYSPSLKVQYKDKWAVEVFRTWQAACDQKFSFLDLISKHTCLAIQTFSSLPRYQGASMGPKCGHAIGLSLDELLMSLRIFGYLFCLIGFRLSFSNQSAEDEVLTECFKCIA